MIAMYDWVKIRVHSPAMRRRLRMNKWLAFREVTLTDRNVPLGYQMAEWGDLKFYGGSQDVIYIQGSLHKQFHGGSNWQQFSYFQLLDVLKEIESFLDVPLVHLRVINLEIGFNIEPIINAQEFPKHIVLHKTTQPRSMVPGRGITIKHSDRYRLKIYDKGHQFPDAGNCLRVEVKIREKTILKSIGIRTLEDLRMLDLWHRAGKYLIKRLGEVVVNEPFIASMAVTEHDRHVLDIASTAEGWLSRTPKQRQTLRQQVNRIHKRAVVTSIKDDLLYKASTLLHDLSAQ